MQPGKPLPGIHSLMAIINSLGVGRGKKSAGELTFRYTRGRTIASRRITSNSSKTIPQVRQRRLFGQVTRGIKTLAQFVDFAYNKTKYGSKRNAATQKLFVPISEIDFMSEDISTDQGDTNAGNILRTLNYNPAYVEGSVVYDLAPGSSDDFSYISKTTFPTGANANQPTSYTQVSQAIQPISNDNPFKITCFFTYVSNTAYITPYLLKRELILLNADDFVTYNSATNEVSIEFSLSTQFMNTFTIPTGMKHYSVIFVVEFEKKRWKVPYSFYLATDA